MSTTLDASPITTLAQMIRDIADESPGVTPDELAGLVLDRIALEDSPLDLLRPAVAHYATTVRRGPTRSLERKIAEDWTPSRSQADRHKAAATITARFMEFAEHTVEIPGVGAVRAGDVTVDQWRSRIGMLKTGVDRIIATVDFYGDVVKALEKHSVVTIDEYLRARA